MDSIAEFLVNIKNARKAGKDKVDVPASNMRKALATVMKNKKWIKDFRVADDGRQGLMRIYLGGLRGYRGEFLRVSKPGRRVYVSRDEIPSVRSGRGFSILSTNKGILTDDEARAQKVGGELLCKLW
ncbi:MAG: 30S ribosomal protein S8 [Bdellovibrionaceae bacterium]|nr:30S ribosomal protein S8 [Pseudobdellovibrionaceae bacterium]MDW8190890.1 30S ribosomal protein S8 [Pseudobdellovibrionaceae bacterium]